jgi:type II secretory pathway component PulF
MSTTLNLTAGKGPFTAPASHPHSPARDPRAVLALGSRKVSRRDIANMTSQLAIMTKSGVDVASALAALARQSQHVRLKDVLLEIHNQVMDGRPFSAALSGFSNIFGDTYVASVAAGEASGRMAEVLASLAQLQRRELKLRSTIRTLMAYPVMLSAVSGTVLMGLVLFVLPQFAALFERYEMPLPVLTRMLLAVAGEIRFRFWLWLPILASPVVALVMMRFSETGRRLRDRLLLRTLVIREVARLLIMGRLCRLLGMMLQSGVTLVDSLRLARSATGSHLFREMFADIERSVINGGRMSDCLERHDFLPDSAADMLRTAEQSGNLGSVSQMIGEHYEEEGEGKLKELVTVLEPAITVGMGVVVAVVVLAVMLPMFDLTTFAQKGSR